MLSYNNSNNNNNNNNSNNNNNNNNLLLSNKKCFLTQKMVNLSLNKLKQIAKMRCINGYRSMSRERLLSALDESNES